MVSPHFYFQLFPVIDFDFDYIELCNKDFFKFSSRSIVSSPFKDSDFGIISPRTFQNFDARKTKFSDARYFSESIEHCFPDITERVRFCNKFYQCFLCWQLPHKIKKLVVVGEKNSGKTSWSKVFFGLMPKEKIAVLSKEKNFGSSMIENDTELLWVDEWKKEMLSEDTIKTMMQGGFFCQAVKHESPKMQNMQAGVYITCNEIPDYGKEQANVELRLYICRTKALKNTCLDAPRWIQENAMKCLLWLALYINQNIHLVEKEERFYERPRDVSANATIAKNVPNHILKQIKTAKMFNPQISSVAVPKAVEDGKTGETDCMIFHLLFYFPYYRNKFN